jgi:hypothetical protein
MKKIKSFIYQIVTLFAFLAILFIPFSFQYSTIQSAITKFLFEDLIVYTAKKAGNILIVNPEISSDSATLYLLFFILFLIAVIAVSVLSFFDFWKTHKNFIFKTIQLIISYYLACVMLKYGFDKIFKSQFYLPEPNTLYTPLGMLDKDILFWSTMGISYSYNVFMGLMEVIPALMLLYYRTRILGLFILSGVLLNVIFINFGFDISVKLYSLFLLLICFLLLAPNLEKIIQFFISNKPVPLSRLKGSDLINSKSIRVRIKIIIIFFIFLETLFPYLQQHNFNDDNISRNPLHGAYEVVKIENEQIHQNTVNLRIKRIFIHRSNYLIFQYADDTMEDFYLEIDEPKHQFNLINYNDEKIKLQYKYSKDSEMLELCSPVLGIKIYSESLPWKKLPVLQPLFHWTVDEIN